MTSQTDSPFRAPQTRRDETADLLHGHLVPDPYRWLEDPDSDDTSAWVAAQNEASGRLLAGIAQRPWFAETMTAVMNRPTLGTPQRSHGLYLQSSNDGTTDQDLWYVADSLAGLSDESRLLLDPNRMGDGQPASIGSISVGPDASVIAWTVAFGGSDWHEIRLSTPDGERVEDEPVVMTKFSSPSWLPDGRSYLYIAYPEAERAASAGTETGDVGRAHLMRHRLGTEQAADELVHVEPSGRRMQLVPWVSDDDRWLVVHLVEGTERTNRLWLWPLQPGQDGETTLGDPVRLLDEADAAYSAVAVVQDRLLLQTDLDAPRSRVVAQDLGRVRSSGAAGLDLVTVVPADDEATLVDVVVVGRQLVTERLLDASPVLQRWTLAGEPVGRLEVTGGAVASLSGDPDSAEGFVGLAGVTEPLRRWRFDTDTGELTELPGPAAPGVPVPEVQVSRHAATSPDGTAVPYWLIRPAGAEGPLPTILYGYGGFKIAIPAVYSPGWTAWVAAGGAVAVANLRGGGEFGTDWYEQGRREHKQNVFDDFVAVGEALKSSGATGADELVIHGRSNGGLLVGAVMTQRPDLAAVALPSVGVLDLYRFHLFTIGGAWRSDYGDPDVKADFEVLRGYSPLHNVRPGTSYPPTLVTTGDHDDRVVPLHSHKFTAALQHAQAGPAPVISRIDTDAGHGAGRPRPKVAAEWADLLSFAAHHTGLVPPG